MDATSCNALPRCGSVLGLGGRRVFDERVSVNRDMSEIGLGLTRGSSGVVHLTALSVHRGIGCPSLACDYWCHLPPTPLRCFMLSDQDNRSDPKCQSSAATRRMIVPGSGLSYPPPNAAFRDEMHIVATRAHERASPFDSAHRLRLWLGQSHLRRQLSVTTTSGRTTARLEVPRRWLHSRRTDRSYTAVRPMGRWHRAIQSDHSTRSRADRGPAGTLTNFLRRGLTYCWPHAEHPRRGLSLRRGWHSS